MQELCTVKYSTIWTKVVLFHCVLKTDQVSNVDAAWILHVLVCKVQIDEAVLSLIVLVHMLV